MLKYILSGLIGGVVLCFFQAHQGVAMQHIDSEPQGGLVIADFAVRGEKGEGFIYKFEHVDLYFLIQNCSDRSKRNLQVQIETGAHTTPVLLNPLRQIQELPPGATELIHFKVTSTLAAEQLEVFINIEENGNMYRGVFAFPFMQDYKYDPAMLEANCKLPVYAFKALLDPSAEAEEPISLALMTEEPTDLPQEVIPRRSLTAHSRNRTSAMIYGGSAMLLAGSATYFYVSAGNLYSEYQLAKQDASGLHERIQRQDRIWQTGFIASTPLLILAGVYYLRYQNEQQTMDISGIPTDNGLVLQLRYRF